MSHPRLTAATKAMLALTMALSMLAMPIIAAADEAESRRTATRTVFTDSEILDGFFKVTLNAEWHTGTAADRIRRFDGPVRVFIDSRAEPDRRAEAAAIIRDIDARVAHLDIATVTRREDANMIVTLVRDTDIDDTIRSIFGRERAGDILSKLDPQCLSGFRRDEAFRIEHAEAIIVVDAGDLTFRDCAYEEILQALGPINDDDSLPWSTFNDEIQHGQFTVFDQLLLNLLYHPRIRPGMTRANVEALAPELLPGVRAFVAKMNAQR